MLPIKQRAPTGFGLADLHIHSRLCDGIPSVEEILEYVEVETSLNVIAITDHDSLRASSIARELTAKNQFSFEVIAGMEVSTNAGHLLALYIESPVPPDEPLSFTIRSIHEQGGLCVFSHPMSRQRDSVDRKALEKLLANKDTCVHPDGLELPDPRVLQMVCLEDVISLNRENYHLAELGNSDAHDLQIIGTRYTIFNGSSTLDLKRSIINRSTRAWGGSLPEDL